MFGVFQSAVGRPTPALASPPTNAGVDECGNSTPDAKQQQRKQSRPPVDMIDTAKKANRSSAPLSSPDGTISPLAGDASTVPSSSPPTGGSSSKLIAQNLRDIINKENIPAPPLLGSESARPPKARSDKPPTRTVAGRKTGRSKKQKKTKRFTLPFLLGYENMVRGQDNADASTITHLRPVFDKLRYIGGDTDVQPVSMGMSDGNDSTTSLGGGDDRSIGTSGTLDTYGTADRSDADKESDALSYLTSLSNRIDLDDGTLLTFAAIAQSLDVLTRKEDEMTCDNNLMLLLQSVTDAVLSASTTQDDEIDEEFECDGLTFTEFLHAYQSVAISIRAMRRFPKEGEDRKGRTRDRAQQLVVSFVPSEIVVEEENMADVDLNESGDKDMEEEKAREMGATVNMDQGTIAKLERTIETLKVEKEEAVNEAKRFLDSRLQSLKVQTNSLEMQLKDSKRQYFEAQAKRSASEEEQTQLQETVSAMTKKIKTLEDVICEITNEKKASLAKAQEELDQTTSVFSKRIQALESEKQTLLESITARDETNEKMIRSNAKKTILLCSAVALAAAAAAAGVAGTGIWNNVTLEEAPTMNDGNVDTTSDELESHPNDVVIIGESIPNPTSHISPRSTHHFALRNKIRRMEADRTEWRKEARKAQERAAFHELMNAPIVLTPETASISNSKTAKVNRFGKIRSHVVSVLSGATVMGLASNIFAEGGTFLAGASVIGSPIVLVTLLAGIAIFALVGRFDESCENL